MKCKISTKDKVLGLYLFSSWTIEVSLCPLITICCSFSCFATWMKGKNGPFKNTLRLKKTHNDTWLKTATTYIFCRWAGDFNPGLGEKGTWSKHEDDVDDCMDGVVKNGAKWFRGREVVTESPHRVGTSRTARRCILHTHTREKSKSVRKTFSYKRD